MVKKEKKNEPTETPVKEEILEAEADLVEQTLADDMLAANVAALEEIEKLQQQLGETQAKADEYLNGWQRALADYANYKKRVEREQAEVYQRAAGSLVKKYIDILDDLDLALNKRPGDGDGAQWADGIELIYRKLQGFLEAEGIMPMNALGAVFDPNQHEAIGMEPRADVESGHVSEVLKEGYLMGERVLRPALVRVAQ
jgi:molecular chaperone GrpE